MITLVSIAVCYVRLFRALVLKNTHRALCSVSLHFGLALFRPLWGNVSLANQLAGLSSCCVKNFLHYCLHLFPSLTSSNLCSVSWVDPSHADAGFVRACSPLPQPGLIPVVLLKTQQKLTYVGMRRLWYVTNCCFTDQHQGEMAAVESGGGFNQKRNTNSQVGDAAGLGSYEIGWLSIARRCPFCVAHSSQLVRFARVWL